jgi:hypothetical protein
LCLTRADTCHRWRGFATPSLDGRRLSAENHIMTAPKKPADPKKQRLAKALKANIAKRKAQAKTRIAATTAPEKPLKD